MKFRFNLILSAFLLGAMIQGSPLGADEIYSIAIKGHQFFPAELTVPANRKFKVVVENQDATAEEFESFDLNREKVVSGNSKITLFLGPLAPGTYKYFGEFHSQTARGMIIAQ